MEQEEVAIAPSPGSESENWRRRLAALVAATGRTATDLLEESVQLLAMKVLRQNSGGSDESEKSKMSNLT